MFSGGGDGGNLAVFKKRLPGLRCTCLDRPEIIQGIKNKPEGVDLVEGDFFKPETIPKADVIILKHILHCWENSKCIEILKSTASVLPVGGLVVTAENILPKFGMIDPQSLDCKSAFNADMNMMIFGCAGRSEEEYRQLYESAGFKVTQVIHTPDNCAQIIIAHKL